MKLKSSILIFLLPCLAVASEPCCIQVVEKGSGWPVPLVELRTTHNVRLVTDNAGVIALDLPELMGREVWFDVMGHGYEVPKDGFGMRGVRLKPEPGKTLRVEVTRKIIAKRLGRLTGAGLFAESQKLGRDLDWHESGVFGCDSVQNAVYQGRLFWAWGDTTMPNYPLGIFDMSSATTSIQPLKSFEPPLRLKLDYFTDAKGTPRGVAKMPGSGPTWVSGYVSLPDKNGNQKLVGTYIKVRGIMEAYESGLCVWNDAASKFDQLRVLWTKSDAQPKQPPAPDGHPIFWKDAQGKEWLLFGNPLPTLRCPPTFVAWQDSSTWEVLKPQETLTSACDGKPVKPHSGSMSWNAFRKRWVTVFMQAFGKPSVFGELWYAEANAPTGPWGKAVKILTHDNYTFYNPRLHPEFTPANSPILIFEGTYTAEFAERPPPTPRYNYNQMIYRLDLDDPALAEARAEGASSTLDQAFARLPSYDWDQSRAGLAVIEQNVVAAHADPAVRKQLEKRLAAVLATPVTRAAKDFVCRQLSLLGTAESVPALEPLLLEPDLSHMARFALERIPSPKAAEALRRCVARANGKLQAGIINSLGILADGQAVSVLTALFKNEDASILAASASALGKIGTLEAARALGQFRAVAPKEVHGLVTDACIIAAEKLVYRGEPAEATRIFEQLSSQETGAPRGRAFRGLLAAERGQAVNRLIRSLAGEDEAMRSVAASIIAETESYSLKPFLDAFGSLPPGGQIAMLEAIHSRRDPTARTAVLAACKSSEVQVRLAALRALGMVGRAEDVAQLANLAAADNSGESAAARYALANLPGREPTDAMLALMAAGKPPLRFALIRALTARAATEAAPVLARQFDDPDEAICRAALESIGVVGDQKQTPAVIAVLKKPKSDTVRQEAEKTLGALVARSGVECLPALLSGINDAGPATRIILLQQLGSLGGHEALEAVRAALSDHDASIRGTAFQLLAGWPDVEAMPDLLRFASQAEPPAQRALAFRGYVRLCREGPMTSARRLAALQESAKLAVDTQEKLLLTSALAEVPDPGSLKLLASYLAEPELADAASLAVVKVALALDSQKKGEAVPVLEQALLRCKNPDLQKQVKSALQKLGGATN